MKAKPLTQHAVKKLLKNIIGATFFLIRIKTDQIVMKIVQGGQWYLGLHHEQCCQQEQGSDCPPLLSSGEATP